MTNIIKRNIKITIGSILLLVAAVNLSGCATGTTLVTGIKRDAIDFNTVRIYHAAPANYEIVAAVKSSSMWGFGEQHNLDLALEEIKKQAAEIGANGVILQNAGEVTTGGSGTFIPDGYGGGVFVGGNSSKQVISGTAIYTKDWFTIY